MRHLLRTLQGNIFGNVTRQVLRPEQCSDRTQRAHRRKPPTRWNPTQEGIYQVTTQTRYNAEGEPLSTIQKQLISQFCPHLEAKTVSIDERGLTSADWIEYTGTVRRIRKSAIPTSDTTAETVMADGFALRQTGYTGVAQRFNRTYRTNGMLLETTDGRGNATTTQTDLLERTVRVTDATGATTTTSYDSASGQPAVITETHAAMGRSAGYAYAKKGTVQQTVTTGYGSDGRISSAGFLHGSSEKQFGYSYLLLQTLTMPCNITLTQSFETQRDLLTGMAYKRGTTGVVERAYTYDVLGRPLTRRTARKGTTMNDTFAYSSRSELTEATVNGGAYSYAYDNIGNRKSAQEAAEEATAYTANALNQYTAIDDFVPTYDADGNQTQVKTSTGIWTVAYNAENRPVTFTRSEEDGTETQVTCTYDSMGRRATKKVTNNGEITLHQRYIYRGYLQIACCDLTRANHPCLWLITWDPTQPVATRPLVIQKSGTWYCYGWDLTKNICEVFSSNGYINTIYTYTPYGEVTSSGSTTQPIQWSSEYLDTELGLVYYNYRHYNPADGRWIGRDPIGEDGNKNLVTYVKNAVIQYLDILGLVSADELIKCINIQIEAQVRWWLFGRDMISWKPGRENAIHKTSKFSGYPMAYVRVEWINSNECCKIKREYLKNPSVNIYFEVWKTNLNGEKYQHTLPGNMTSNVLLGRRDPQEVTLAMASHYNGNGDFAHGSQTIGLGNSTYKFQLLISVGKYTILDEEYYL